MKNLKISLIVALVIGATLTFNACNPDDGTDVSANPKLNFLAGTGYTSTNTTIAAGSSFKVGLSASHTKKIETLKIRVSYSGGSKVVPDNCTICDTTINKESFTLDFTNTVENSIGTETWYFTVTDKDGASTESSLTFTRTAAPKAVRASQITLGNQNSTQLGSSFNMQAFAAMLLKDAKLASDSIDLCYVKDDIGGAVLCAPSSTVAATYLKGTSGTNAVSTWSTRNATKIRKTTITKTEFDDIVKTNSAKLLAEVSSTAATTDNVTVSVNDVYYVGPVSGAKYCLIRINSIDVDNTMTIEMLVEDE
ncbi:MAG: hypothetical protein GC181_06215 [Bacteroidetes bacterium]|nr:hypothetical protein [Bacteroidota bacterium]